MSIIRLDPKVWRGQPRPKSGLFSLSLCALVCARRGQRKLCVSRCASLCAPSGNSERCAFLDLLFSPCYDHFLQFSFSLFSSARISVGVISLGAVDSPFLSLPSPLWAVNVGARGALASACASPFALFYGRPLPLCWRSLNASHLHNALLLLVLADQHLQLTQTLIFRPSYRHWHETVRQTTVNCSQLSLPNSSSWLFICLCKHLF